MRKILKLNEISPVIGDVFDKNYSVEKACENPDGIILRSFDMHGYAVPQSVLCVGRAGAGTNNIPVDELAEKGVVVFNTPGANANAVKELVLCAMFLCGRKILDGINWTASLKGKGAEVAKLVESGKKDFVGGELMRKKLGVVGLGAIGVHVANAAVDLGMDVRGYDPYISIKGAWNLNHHVIKQDDVNELFRECDYITLHVPLNDATRKLINRDTIALMKPGAAVINCSRGELADNAAVIEAVASGKLSRYVTDFPADELIGVKNIIAVPHLGASTPEAEDNCAYMAAKQMADFFENGNITNSVNFPACSLAKSGVQRVTVIHNNVKNVLSKITETISGQGINISGFVSQSENRRFAYAIIDVDEALTPSVIEKIRGFENIVKVRVI
ncbi:MAG: 3-phosphoglycerate dehydrogenase [Clostridiales bacterium]|jgi:D-3-phosphoglycerate dehydrogenase|nr:3-phosphoglycerate dehydrogenase [Clostridiales bacterium]